MTISVIEGACDETSQAMASAACEPGRKLRLYACRVMSLELFACRLRQ